MHVDAQTLLFILAYGAVNVARPFTQDKLRNKHTRSQSFFSHFLPYFFFYFISSILSTLFIHSSVSFHLIIVFFCYQMPTINLLSVCNIHDLILRDAKQCCFNDGLKVIDWCGCWMHKFKLSTGTHRRNKMMWTRARKTKLK